MSGVRKASMSSSGGSGLSFDERLGVLASLGYDVVTIPADQALRLSRLAAENERLKSEVDQLLDDYSAQGKTLRFLRAVLCDHAIRLDRIIRDMNVQSAAWFVAFCLLAAFAEWR